jgi:hypothetical protein
LYPKDKVVAGGNLECWPEAEARLGQQPLATRIKKTRRDYEARVKDLSEAWPSVEAALGEARRFGDELRAAIRAL